MRSFQFSRCGQEFFVRQSKSRGSSFLVSLAIAFLGLGAQAQSRFPHEFAPENGLVAPIEKANRSELCLNGKWQFQPIALPVGFKTGQGTMPELTPPQEAAWDKTPIRIPSPWNVNSFPDDKMEGGDFRTYPSYPDAWKNVQMGWLRRSFIVPAAWKGKRLILHFGAVAGQTEVSVNGKPVGEHNDIFLPFDLDITDAVKIGSANTLQVGVRKSSLRDVQGKYGRRPYQGGSFWGQHIAGIWQDVFLEAVPTVHIENVFVKPSVDKGLLEAEVTVRNDSARAAKVSLGASVSGWKSLAGRDIVSAPEPKWTLETKTALRTRSVGGLVPQGGTVKLTLTARVGSSLKFWSPESPNLYGLVCNLKDSAGKAIDAKYTRFGWRQLTFNKGQVELNGKPIVMKGDSWHFMGIPQMTRRYAWAWFKAAKDANLNAVRLHAQPYPSFYLDVADEMGMMVLDESAMWASDGGPKLDDPAYWADSENHMKGLVLRDRNHPSVFGWSVSNEVLPVIRNVFHGPKSMEDELVRHFTIWSKICRDNDPTRAWISADGEDDGEGTLPTYVNHYGGPDSMKRALASGKPWGVGEAGPAYYGSPEEIARFANDPNAYLSFPDRMEGVAAVSFKDIANQRQYDASYRSVFNLVWYGLQPLELGMSDTTKAPKLSDGIFFGPYVEGKPGVQPERLGPYCTTLNPGYDPKLPLYRTWPLFDAIRDAQAKILVDNKPPHSFVPLPDLPAPKDTVTAVRVLAGTDGALEKNLSDMGVPVHETESSLVFIDGLNPPGVDAKAEINRVLTAGGTVVVWGGSPESVGKINALLPATIELTDRTASSLVPLSRSPLLAGVTPAGLYFSELSPATIISNGLTGPFIKQGVSLLGASNTDWTRWNRQGEPTKTAMVLRSEREAKPSGVALAELASGGGRILVTTLPAVAQSTKAAALNRAILENLGIKLGETAAQRNMLDGGGVVTRALALGNFPASSIDEALTTEKVKPDAGVGIVAGAMNGNRSWTSLSSEPVGDFNLNALKKQDGVSFGYLSFWLYSPKALDNLLLDPHLPVLDLDLKGASGARFWLNGASLPTKNEGDTVTAPTLLLQQGWNQVLIKVVHSGEGNVSLKLRSSQADYLGQLRGAEQAGIEPKRAAPAIPQNGSKIQAILDAEKGGAIVVSSERDETARQGRHFKVEGDWVYPGVWSVSKPINKAIWEAQLPKAGTYRVEIWFGADPNNDHSQNATVTVRSATTPVQKPVNLHVNAGQWVPLGTFQFSKEHDAVVTLEGGNGTGNLVADAVRFVPTNP